jgi:hypothetical protein
MKHELIVEVPIEDGWIDEARKHASELGTLPLSFMKGTRNLVGFLGEVVVKNYLGDKSVKYANRDVNNINYDFDLQLSDGRTLDVKTKQCGTWSPNAKPKLNYECSVPAYSLPIQNCDIYVFVRIHSDLSKAWICGYKDKKDFAKEAKLFKKGEINGSNKLPIKTETYQLLIEKLEGIDGLKINK